MTVDELLTKLVGVDPDTPVVFEFGTEEGLVSDAELYTEAEVDAPVFLIYCSEEME